MLNLISPTIASPLLCELLPTGIINPSEALMWTVANGLSVPTPMLLEIWRCATEPVEVDEPVIFSVKVIFVNSKPPVSIFTFIENLNVRFIKKKYQDQSSINVKEFYLDINSRELKKGNITLKLTERETDMILFLNNSKKPVNVETLEKEIWQHSSELETHTVETHIYRLRKKIKAEFGNEDLIKSNKNGYTI